MTTMAARVQGGYTEVYRNTNTLTIRYAVRKKPAFAACRGDSMRYSSSSLKYKFKELTTAELSCLMPRGSRHRRRTNVCEIYWIVYRERKER